MYKHTLGWDDSAPDLVEKVMGVIVHTIRATAFGPTLIENTYLNVTKAYDFIKSNLQRESEKIV